MEWQGQIDINPSQEYIDPYNLLRQYYQTTIILDIEFSIIFDIFDFPIEKMEAQIEQVYFCSINIETSIGYLCRHAAPHGIVDRPDLCRCATWAALNGAGHRCLLVIAPYE